MSPDETDLIERLHAVAAGFQMPPAPAADDVRRGRRRVRRNRRLVVGAVAAGVALVVGVTAAVDGRRRAEPAGPNPVKPPGIVVGAVPVWYDAKGLHRGDVVEPTAVPIGTMDVDGVTMRGALTLVRSGALYADPATGDVWFHPWGGVPHIVGHHSIDLIGDPDGDTAGWFEDNLPTSYQSDPVELVVYDTAAGREISRTSEGPIGLGPLLQVSAERVVWRGNGSTSTQDLRTRTTSVTEAGPSHRLLDVHDQVEVTHDWQAPESAVVLSVPGRAEQRYNDLESSVQLSAGGQYLLAGALPFPGLQAAIIDISTGERWEPKNVRVELDHPKMAWSYGDIALWDTEHALLACDVSRRTCERLAAQRPFLMPTS